MTELKDQLEQATAGDDGEVRETTPAPISRPVDASTKDPNSSVTSSIPDILRTLSKDSAVDDLGDDVDDNVAVTAVNNGVQPPQQQPSKSVHPVRKEELLLQARAERLKWIQQVPLPFRKTTNTENNINQDALEPFASNSHISKHAPTTLSVLSYMYGLEDDSYDEKHSMKIAKRVSSLVEEEEQQQQKHGNGSKSFAKLTGYQILQAEIDEDTNADNETLQLLNHYHDFLRKLQDPACALIVQNMRTFCRHYFQLSDLNVLKKTIQMFLQSTLQSLLAVWKQRQQEPTNENIKRALDSFLYGQCWNHIEYVYYNLKIQNTQQEGEWMERLQSLQFLTPAHLDMNFENHYSNISDQLALLKDSIEAVQSIDLYYSPFEKLQRVLAVYRNVNAALSTLTKVPTADDVLPTIILVVLRAQAKRLPFCLKFMDDFCLPEHLRGEAGYAYTNLFGAVQFLKELDLKEPKSLSIDQETFSRELQACRDRMQEKHEVAIKQKQNVARVQMTQGDLSVAPVRVPTSHVRAARIAGEVVDLEWALQWQAEHAFSQVEVEDDHKYIENYTAGLPPGFSRHYSFLTCQPEDIKVSDLALLLEEYKMLVRTTETLLGERAAKANAARRAKQKATRKELIQRASEIDPSLIEKDNQSKKNNS